MLQGDEMMGPISMVKLKEQSGTALIIALIMIVVLTLIGVASTFTSIFETKLSGIKRESTAAYYAADAAAQAVFNNEIVNFQRQPTDVPITNPTVQLPLDLRGDPVDRMQPTPIIQLPSGGSFSDPPQVTIYHLRREGGEGLQYSWDAYIVGAVGRDQIVTMGIKKSECTVRQKWLLRRVSDEEGS
jgi:hypothetical protein